MSFYYLVHAMNLFQLDEVKLQYIFVCNMF